MGAKRAKRYLPQPPHSSIVNNPFHRTHRNDTATTMCRSYMEGISGPVIHMDPPHSSLTTSKRSPRSVPFTGQEVCLKPSSTQAPVLLPDGRLKVSSLKLTELGNFRCRNAHQNFPQNPSHHALIGQHPSGTTRMTALGLVEASNARYEGTCGVAVSLNDAL